IIVSGMYYPPGATSAVKWLPILYGVAFISLAYGFFRRKLDPPARFNHWVRLLQFLTFSVLCISLVSVTPGIRLAPLALWAIVILFLMFTERKIFHDTDLRVENGGIYVPGYLGSHTIPWNAIENFVLRADYLTIIRTNKKYVQLELMKDLSEDEIKQINVYCQEQIEGGTTVRTIEQKASTG
ncbi:MAG: hypothetical protein WKF70_13495, partial [Chitinophagaceae bacterium]